MGILRHKGPHMKPEQIESSLLASHIKKYHPTIIHRFDLAADMPLTPGQAARAKQLQGNEGYPDVFISEPHGGYHGLYIEMKKNRAEVFKKDGTYKKSKHLDKQIVMRRRLQLRGYRVEWGLGAQDAIKKLEEYLSAT